ncbi:signal recognition particle receptor FtsY [Lysobacter xinjiangensis]|uniref:Signal recognition particle receptor FtsY n=1 Tax=Cognatilysobacter xinjiangensis TaxID=546892 RepID=A0ABQ3C0H4_9GAMM|nr:signal recognition particle-docking protein FtsY [Lysobacter xinjiangensis]GGZ59922.1 signal recognition particle receptor FtsY [Lysobacter xinjiangensis]
MLSFLRRKKPDEPQRRLSVEELAAAFPNQDAAPAETVADEPVGESPSPAIEATGFAARVEAAGTSAETPADETIEDARTAAVASEAALDVAINDPAVVDAAAESLAPAEAPVAMPEAEARIEAPDVEPASVESAPAVEPAPAVKPASADVPGIATDAPAAPAGKRGWLERLRGNAITRSLGGLFSRNPKLDDDLLDEIETALITADVGVTATTELVERLRKRMKAREFADANALLSALRADLLAMLEPVARPLVIDRATRPFVLLTIGVNGVGKTTTIGKLARRFKDEGRTLMLAAGDTFRAAAVAQLQAWGDRNGVHVVAQGQNADAASVAFDALQAAKARGTEVLIADTAGRLHTQQGLMAELGKIKRVLQKLDPAAPHEVLLVIDGTTGQNAISQLRQFNAAIGVTGLVVTKLDGTAKGGVVFALAREFGIPIRFAGIGERPEDLRVFDAAAFVDALLPESLGAG